MNPVFQKQMDSPLSGFVVIGYNPIREVPIIELRNNKSSSTDSSNMFYRMHLLGFTEENNFSLRRYYRIQKIAQRYVHYSIAYSFQSKDAIETSLSSSEFSNHILFYSQDLYCCGGIILLRLVIGLELLFFSTAKKFIDCQNGSNKRNYLNYNINKFFIIIIRNEQLNQQTKESNNQNEKKFICIGIFHPTS